MDTHRQNVRKFVSRRDTTHLAGIEDDLRKAALDYYVKKLKGYEPQLAKQGQKLAKRVLTVLPIPFYTPPKSSGPPAPKPPAWVGEVTGPIVNPVLAGFKEEITPPLKRFALIAGVGLVGLLGLTFFVGYRVGKKRTESGRA